MTGFLRIIRDYAYSLLTRSRRSWDRCQIAYAVYLRARTYDTVV